MASTPEAIVRFRFFQIISIAGILLGFSFSPQMSVFAQTIASEAQVVPASGSLASSPAQEISAPRETELGGPQGRRFPPEGVLAAEPVPQRRPEIPQSTPVANPAAPKMETVGTSTDASGSVSIEAVQAPDRYLQDEARLVKDPIRGQILSACREIESSLRIRVLVRTQVLDDLGVFPGKVESFFLDWIREIDNDKRGILLFAALGKDSLQGKVSLRVGMGLKYLITKEMGERILNRVIIPNNTEKNDGKAFLEGILAIKGMLLDEFKREQQRQVQATDSFDLFGFIWKSKEIMLVVLIGIFLCYLVFFMERCPRCNGNLSISREMLKEPGVNTLGLRRVSFSCVRCGFNRRKKEPVYPFGRTGLWMWLTGARRNVKTVSFPQALPNDFSSDERKTPPE